MTLGALLADTPHTRPIPVTGTATEPELADRLKLEQSNYEGPTGIVGVFQDACTQLDIPAVSFWAAVPHYVAQPPCPKATLALLGQLEDLLEISVPLADLPEEARAWERGVDELAEEDEEIADYVRALEETRDTAELPEASGEAIAREFERYLKRRETPGRADRSRAVGAGASTSPEEDAEPRVEHRCARPCPRRAVAPRPRGPGVDRGQRGRGVEVVGQRPPRVHRPGPRHPPWRRGHRGPPGGEPGRLGRHEVAVGPLPVAAVVVGEQRQPDRHRVHAALAQRGDEHQVALATSTSSRPGSPPSRRARRPSRRSARRTPPGPPRRSSRGAGTPGRCRRPARRRSRRGSAARSRSTRRASPAGRGPARSPRPARRVARPARAGSRAGASCPAGPGRRRARRRARASRRRRGWTPSRSAGRQWTEVQVAVDLVDRAAGLGSRWTSSTTSGIDSTAPT